MVPAHARLRTVLAMVFFASGAASLIFQVVWQRLLTLYYGVGPVSITLIVSVYMLGLGLGSLLGGYLAEKSRRRVAWYLGIELALGLFGLLSLPYLEFLGRHTAGSSHWVSFLWIALFLCVPTLCMGMTLPLIVKIFNRFSPRFLDTVASLYFINTLGAALGALLASYVLISFLGLDRTIYVAAGIDFAVAAIIYLAQRSVPAEEDAPSPAGRVEAQQGELRRAAFVLVFVTGFVAIGLEIVWFRFLEVLLKASPYAFSTVLAVYLTGIALGSYLMRRILRKRPGLDKRSLFFFLQFLIGIYVLVVFTGFYVLTRSTSFGQLTRLSFSAPIHPWWGMPEHFSSWQTRFLALDIFLWPALFVLVPTILMGASFPLLSLLALSDPEQEGKTVGRVYFCNTVGNVLGGGLTGFVILPLLGTERALLVFAAVCVGMLLFLKRAFRREVPLWGRLAVCSAVLAVAVLYFPHHGRLYGVIHPRQPGWAHHFEEGVDGVVLTLEHGDEVHNYINGLFHGIRPGPGFYREAAEAVCYAGNTENVLVIGFGTGSITEALLKLPDVKRVTLVEINQTLMTNLKKMEVFRQILADPRLEIVIDDGRRFLMRGQRPYDMILIDPLDTTTAYSNNLYSREFFELAAANLTSEGLFLVWMDEHRVMPRTVASAFAEVRVYNHCCLASRRPLGQHLDRRQVLLASFTPEERQAIDSFPLTYLGDAGYVAQTTQGYPINRDWRPNCEYFLGLNLRKSIERLD